MRSQALLSASLGISLTLADPIAAIIPQITPTPILTRRAETITNTQHPSPSIFSECSSALRSLFTSRPQPYPEGLSLWLATGQHTQTITTPPPASLTGIPKDVWANPRDLDEFCGELFTTITPPAELAEAYTEYSDAVSKWAKATGSVVRSYVSKCSSVDEEQQWLAGKLLIGIATDVEECKTGVTLLFDLDKYLGGVTSTAAGLDGVKPTGGPSSSSSTGVAAATGPRETVFAVGMAVAAVGAVVAGL
ncbi:hypothetical protein QBC43DRAFT_350559 [Cladorrhinum sp. PSN259]|nr:hypothetical protein QBC43DRAFT_350559 [Cladorrhinum sp. PSN259]